MVVFNSRLAGLFLSVGLAASAAVSSAATYVLGASGDATIADNLGSPFGSMDSFLVNWSGANSSLGLIQFDLSSIPGTEVILSATMTVTHTFNIGNGKTLELYRNTSSWSENTVVFSSAPTFDPTLVASYNITDSLGNTPRSFNITSLALQWHTGAVSNFGLRVVLNPDDPDWIYLASKEHATEAFRPTLTIETQPVPEPATLAALGLGAVALLRRRRKSA